MMFLDKNTFSTVIASTPLVPIDLVVKNHQSQVLLGQRLNRPAQGFWFVPGGRILKNEFLDAEVRFRVVLSCHSGIRRMWKRYLVTNSQFAWLLAKEKWFKKSKPSTEFNQG